MLHRAALELLNDMLLPPFSTTLSPNLIELDVVGREQARLAAKVAEPPVVVREFLGLKSIRFSCNFWLHIKLTMPVIFPPSGKLSSLSSAAS